MKISGLQKLTLLDYPGKVACTVFTYGCNFRCSFCHNAMLVTEKNDDNISFEEFFSFLEKRQGILDAVCVTGGEPTLQKGLDEFLARIKTLGFSTKLDTNGYEPEILESLIDRGLVDYVAMDIKSSPASYSKICGTDIDMERIMKSIAILKQDKVDYEFRTTTVREYHTREDFRAIGDMLEGAKRYFLQHFEDSGMLIGENVSAFSAEEMENFASIVRQKVPETALRGV